MVAHSHTIIDKDSLGRWDTPYLPLSILPSTLIDKCVPIVYPRFTAAKHVIMAHMTFHLGQATAQNHD